MRANKIKISYFLFPLIAMFLFTMPTYAYTGKITEQLLGNELKTETAQIVENNTEYDIYNWKEMTEEEINEALYEMEYEDVGYFLMSLEDEEVEELMSMDTILVKHIDLFNSNDGEDFYVDASANTYAGYALYSALSKNINMLGSGTTSDGYYVGSTWSDDGYAKGYANGGHFHWELYKTDYSYDENNIEQTNQKEDSTKTDNRLVKLTGIVKKNITSNDRDANFITSGALAIVYDQNEAEAGFSISGAHSEFKFHIWHGLRLNAHYTRPAHYFPIWDDNGDYRHGRYDTFTENYERDTLPRTHLDSDNKESFDIQINGYHCGLMDGYEKQHTTAWITWVKYRNAFIVDPNGGSIQYNGFNTDKEITIASKVCNERTIIPDLEQAALYKEGHEFSEWKLEADDGASRDYGLGRFAHENSATYSRGGNIYANTLVKTKLIAIWNPLPYELKVYHHIYNDDGSVTIEENTGDEYFYGTSLTAKEISEKYIDPIAKKYPDNIKPSGKGIEIKTTGNELHFYYYKASIKMTPSTSGNSWTDGLSLRTWQKGSMKFDWSSFANADGQYFGSRYYPFAGTSGNSVNTYITGSASSPTGSKTYGYADSTENKQIYFKDNAAPDDITNVTQYVDNETGNAGYSWTTPNDNGTPYFGKVNYNYLSENGSSIVNKTTSGTGNVKTPSDGYYSLYAYGGMGSNNTVGFAQTGKYFNSGQTIYYLVGGNATNNYGGYGNGGSGGTGPNCYSGTGGGGYSGIALASFSNDLPSNNNLIVVASGSGGSGGNARGSAIGGGGATTDEAKLGLVGGSGGSGGTTGASGSGVSFSLKKYYSLSASGGSGASQSNGGGGGTVNNSHDKQIFTNSTAYAGGGGGGGAGLYGGGGGAGGSIAYGNSIGNGGKGTSGGRGYGGSGGNTVSESSSSGAQHVCAGGGGGGGSSYYATADSPANYTSKYLDKYIYSGGSWGTTIHNKVQIILAYDWNFAGSTTVASAEVNVGTYGALYVKDKTPNTKITLGTTAGTTTAGLRLTANNYVNDDYATNNTEEVYWLHIAPVDNGGNVGNTVHIKLEPTTSENRQYKIVYKGLEGAIDPQNPSFYTTDDNDFELKNPKSEDKIFCGWSEENGYNIEPSDTTYDEDVTVDTSLAVDLIFTAHWIDKDPSEPKDPDGQDPDTNPNIHIYSKDLDVTQVKVYDATNKDANNNYIDSYDISPYVHKSTSDRIDNLYYVKTGEVFRATFNGYVVGGRMIPLANKNFMSIKEDNALTQKLEFSLPHYKNYSNAVAYVKNNTNTIEFGSALSIRKGINLNSSPLYNILYDGKVEFLYPQTAYQNNQGDTAYSKEYQENKKAIVASDGVAPVSTLKKDTILPIDYVDIEIVDNGTKTASGVDPSTIEIYAVKDYLGHKGYDSVTGKVDGYKLTDNPEFSKYITTSQELDVDESDYKNSSKYKYHIEFDPSDLTIRDYIAGKFDLIVIAKDNVGNKGVYSYEIDLGITVDASIANIAIIGSPASNMQSFRRGETGELIIETSGYVSKLEIEFPKKIYDYNEELKKITILNENPNYLENNNFIFKIVFETEEFEEYEGIKITAYNDYGSDPGTDVVYLNVNGNVTDDLKVRIRNNN